MTDEDKTLLRHAALEVLVSRHPTALSLAGIRRRLARELDFTCSDDELTGALVLLKDLGLVKAEPDPLGSLLYYRATGAGLLAVERATIT